MAKDFSRFEPVPESLPLSQRISGGAAYGASKGSALGPVGSVVGGLAGAAYGALNPESQLKTGLGTSLATEAVKAPFYAAELPARAVGYVTGRNPKDKFISEQIQQAKEKHVGKYEPKNIVEKGLQYTAGNWPALFIGGAPTLGKVASDIAGSTALAASEKISKNPVVGIGADILGRKGFRAAGNYLAKAPKDIGKIRSYISHLYSQEAKVGAKRSGSTYAKNIGNQLDTIGERVSREYLNKGNFDEAARTRVRENLRNAEQALNKPNISLADLAQEEKNLNKAWSWKNSTENKYYKDIKNAFSNELKKAATQNKKWGNFYTPAKELYAIDKWDLGLNNWVNGAVGNGTIGKIITNPHAQALVSFLTGLATKGPSAAVLGAAAPYVAKGAVKGAESAARGSMLFKRLLEYPGGRKLLMDIVIDAAKNNTSALNKSMSRLNSVADKLGKKDFSRFEPA